MTNTNNNNNNNNNNDDNNNNNKNDNNHNRNHNNNNKDSLLARIMSTTPNSMIIANSVLKHVSYYHYYNIV